MGGPSALQAGSSASATVANTNTQNLLPSDKFSEGDIKELTAMGFSREQAIFELRRFNGDKTQATAALFAKSLKF